MKKNEQIQWYNNLNKKFTFALDTDGRIYRDLNGRNLFRLDDPSPQLLRFWSEDFKADGIEELWRNCTNPREKNAFLKDIIFSNKIELVTEAKNKGLFNQYGRTGEWFSLEHYAVMCGNSDIYLAIPKLDLFFAPYGIIDFAVMHENTQFIRTVLDHLVKAKENKTYASARFVAEMGVDLVNSGFSVLFSGVEKYNMVVGALNTYINPRTAHSHFLNSALSPLMYAANPEILNILHEEKYGFCLKASERQDFFERMAQNHSIHHYRQDQSRERCFRLYQPPLENFKYLYLKYGHLADTFFETLDRSRILFQAMASHQHIVHFENFPLLYAKKGAYAKVVCNNLDRNSSISHQSESVGNEPLIRWLIQELGTAPLLSSKAMQMMADNKINFSQYKCDSDDTKKLISTGEKYYLAFLSNHFVKLMIDLLEFPLSHLFCKDLITLIAEYAIPVGQVSDLNSKDQKTVKYLKYESQLRDELLKTVENDQRERMRNVLSFWESKPLAPMNSSRISATVDLPSAAQLHNMEKELKYLQNSVPDFKDLDSVKSYIKQILGYNSIKEMPVDIQKLESTDSWASLYGWCVTQEKQLVASNHNFRSAACKYILDLTIANLARVCNRLIKLRDQELRGQVLNP